MKTIFRQHRKFGPIRLVVKKGEVFFAGKDIASIIECPVAKHEQISREFASKRLTLTTANGSEKMCVSDIRQALAMVDGWGTNYKDSKKLKKWLTSIAEDYEIAVTEETLSIQQSFNLDNIVSEESSECEIVEQALVNEEAPAPTKVKEKLLYVGNCGVDVFENRKNKKLYVKAEDVYSSIKEKKEYVQWLRFKLALPTTEFTIENEIYYFELETAKEILSAYNIITLIAELDSIASLDVDFHSGFEIIEKALTSEDLNIKNTELTEEESMNTALTLFQNNQFGEVRFLKIEGKDYAVGKDIAVALGYVNPTKAISTHCKGVSKMGIPTDGGMQTMSCIAEGDIYRLIVRSKLPEAEKFEKWVFEEVLPSIRKNGMYATDMTLDKMVSDPDFAIGLLNKLKDEKAERLKAEKEKLALEEAVKENEPKVIAYDDFINSDETYTFNQAAKILRIPRTAYTHKSNVIGFKTLLLWLRRDCILIKDGAERNIPYQRYINQGWFEVYAKKDEDGKTSKRLTVEVTPKGIEGLYKKYRYDNMPSKIIINDAEIIEEDDIEEMAL